MTEDDVVRQAFHDWQWARDNQDLQERYNGELIAVHQRKVIAHGSNRGVLLDEARKRGLSGEQVVIVNMLPADFETPPDAIQ